MTTNPNPISAEARGRLRRAWAAMEAEAEATLVAWARLPPLLALAARRKGQEGRRARPRLLAAMPTPPVHQVGAQLVWRLLTPRTSVPGSTDASSPSDRQSCIAVEALIANAGEGAPKQRQPFGLVVTLHAAGRLLDRTGQRADVRRAIIEAHDALLALQPTEGHQVFGLDHVVLPVTGGAFLAMPSALMGDAPMMVCRTFLSAEQTDAEVDRDLAAWRRLLDTEAAA